MESDEQTKAQADTAVLAGDHWLRQNGIVSDFSVNTILAYVYLNYPKIANVEIDLDKANQKLYVSVYITFWRLVWLMITQKRTVMVDDLFMWLCEYLPTYKVSIRVVRARETRPDVVTPRSLNPDIDPEETELRSNLGN